MRDVMLTQQTMVAFDTVDPQDGTVRPMPYLLYTPGNAMLQQSWPLILFLHGGGERGSDLVSVARHGIPREIEAGRRIPAFVVSPQCREGEWWNSHELIQLLDSVVRSHPVDQDRIYLTGMSMGGFGSWDLALTAPRQFAALAPVCGGTDGKGIERLAHLPIWVFHGMYDDRVPLARSADLVNALYAAGGEPRFTVYADAGHDSWSKTYGNDAFYQWLFRQRRP